MDFRSRTQIKNDKRRKAERERKKEQAHIEQSNTLETANNRQIAAIDNRMADLAQYAAAAKDEIERGNNDRQYLNDEVTNLKQELAGLHAMIQSSGSQDMEMINQMNANYEKRMATLMTMIGEI